MQTIAHSPKLAKTVIHPTVCQREAVIGRSCEVLEHGRIEHATVGDFSYIGQNCMVANARIGKFCAIAASVRIGARKPAT